MATLRVSFGMASWCFHSTTCSALRRVALHHFTLLCATPLRFALLCFALHYFYSQSTPLHCPLLHLTQIFCAVLSSCCSCFAHNFYMALPIWMACHNNSNISTKLLLHSCFAPIFALYQQLESLIPLSTQARHPHFKRGAQKKKEWR